MITFTVVSKGETPIRWDASAIHKVLIDQTGEPGLAWVCSGRMMIKPVREIEAVEVRIHRLEKAMAEGGPAQ